MKEVIWKPGHGSRDLKSCPTILVIALILFSRFFSSNLNLPEIGSERYFFSWREPTRLFLKSQGRVPRTSEMNQNFTLLRPRLTSMPISLGLSTSVASRRRHGYPQVSHMCFPPYLPDLCASLPEQLWVNRPLPTFPRYTPHIRFLFVRLEFCYRLPSSRSLPPSTCTTHSSFPGSGGQRTFTA